MTDLSSSGFGKRIGKLLRRTNLQTAIYKEMERALAAGTTLSSDSVTLPTRYGQGLPERTVEILFARLTYVPGARVLDIGHANIMNCHYKMVDSLPPPRHLTGIDIADPGYNTTPLYEHSVRGDIIAPPFEDGSFDLIWCISSLEHFGMDNSGYTENFTRDDTMDVRAIREMLRILAPGGRVLISVPYGRFEDHGTQKNYDRDHWQRLLTIGRIAASVREWYFRHTFGNGWHQVPAEELRYVGYYDQANAGAGGVAITIMQTT